jgi:osmotically-inducible protein OsmY
VSTTEVTSSDIRSSSKTFIEDDPVLTHRVESALASDPLLSINARNVDVSVTGGVATLRGSVADVEFSRDVERAVKNVPGLAGIRNDVDVSILRDRDGAESDEQIAFSLQRSLASLPALQDDTDRVTVDVSRGIVTLRGATSYDNTRERIERIAEQTPGVVAIADELKVE